MLKSLEVDMMKIGKCLNQIMPGRKMSGRKMSFKIKGSKNHEKIEECLVGKRLVGKCLNRKMSELDGGLLQNV